MSNQANHLEVPRQIIWTYPGESPGRQAQQQQQQLQLELLVLLELLGLLELLPEQPEGARMIPHGVVIV